MNLALKDIRHGLFRFVLTCFGLGLLMTVVMAMIGIYNGLVSDALAVVKAPSADVWVVEPGTKGPFAEASSIPADTRHAVARMPGVTEAGAVNYQNVEASHAGRTLRLYVVGYEPGRPGGPEPAAAARRTPPWPRPAATGPPPSARRAGPPLPAGPGPSARRPGGGTAR